MTWPIALLFAFAALFALAYVGAICGMLGLALFDVICAGSARVWRALGRTDRRSAVREAL